MFLYGIDINDTADIDAAVADKYTNSRRFTHHINFFGNFYCNRVASPCFGKIGGGRSRSSTGLGDGSGNVFGPLKNPAGIDARRGSGHRGKGIGLYKMMPVEFNPQLLGQIHRTLRNFQPHRKDQHAEYFLFDIPAFIHIPYGQISGFRHLIHRVNPGLDKIDALFVSGPVIVFFVILAKCPHVHIEDNTVQVPVSVLLGNHGLFDRVHAAYRRTVTVAAAIAVPGSHALQPRNSFGFLAI